MPTLAGFNTFAALPEEQISEKISRRILSGDQGMLVWWSIEAGDPAEQKSGYRNPAIAIPILVQVPGGLSKKNAPAIPPMTIPAPTLFQNEAANLTRIFPVIRN